MKTFILILVFSFNLYAKTYGEVNCQVPHYAYINGILNEQKKDAQESAESLKNSLNLNQNVETFYNQSFGPKVDLLRAMFQKLEESQSSILHASKRGLILVYGRKIFGEIMNVEDKSTDNLARKVLIDNQKVVNQQIIEAYDPNKKLIIFSHSQGNLYANKACDDLSMDYFENIQIATPSADIKCGKPNHYTSIHTDEMVQIVRKLGVPFSWIFQMPIKSPLNSNVHQQNSVYKMSNPNFPLPTNMDEVMSIMKMLENNDFAVHSISNYLSNPPSLNKIKKDLKEVLGNNYQTSHKDIIKSEEVNVSCENIEEFVETKIPITRMPASVIDKSIKLGKNEKVNLYIEKKGHNYKISEIDLDSWVAKKFWWLYVLAFPFGLMIAGTIASSVKKSEDDRKNQS